MWWNNVSSNVKEGLAYLDHIDDGDGAFNFKEIERMQLRYPNVFYPLYKLQTEIIQHTLGELWWETHKAYLVETKDKRKALEMAELAKKKKEEAKEKEIVSDEMIQKRMGFFKYHLMPWLRATEKNRILKIAAIEHEIDDRFEDERYNY